MPQDSVRLIDTTLVRDSLGTADTSIAIKQIVPKKFSLKGILEHNIYLNSKDSSNNLVQIQHHNNSKDIVFYLLLFVVLIFAVLKYLYARYFSNLFRVFFNTSLRQGQLTDQLLQAKLPSLFFNMFFILIGGWYLYLLLYYFGYAGDLNEWQLLFSASSGLVIIYLFKFLILKFTGWITGFMQEADTYIFIVFMINKIVSICLIPLVIIMAFSERRIAGIAILCSFLVIGFMILMRFIRSYSLLQNRLKVSRFHFFIYITGIEIVPLLVIYKLALLFISKKM
ncbi:MAG: DUF4271 domain-containing protein [Ferruginibacter sp.]